MRLFEEFPFADGKNSRWPIVQVVTIPGSKLRLLLKARYVAFCMVQVAIIDECGKRQVMYGWVNLWGVFRPTNLIHAALQEFGIEVDAEQFNVGMQD